MLKDLLQHEARWWERLSGLDLTIEYCPEGKNPANKLSRRPDYIESDKDKWVMHIVEYVTRNSTKDKCIRKTAKSVQASDSTEITSEPNQVLENQPTTDKNS